MHVLLLRSILHGMRLLAEVALLAIVVAVLRGVVEEWCLTSVLSWMSSVLTLHFEESTARVLWEYWSVHEFADPGSWVEFR